MKDRRRANGLGTNTGDSIMLGDEETRRAALEKS